jgi:hypothetical protein
MGKEKKLRMMGANQEERSNEIKSSMLPPRKDAC